MTEQGSKDLTAGPIPTVSASCRLSEDVQQFFGHRPRPFQSAATKAICERRDTIVIAPTGAGKSLLFHMPLMEKREEIQAMVVVITPLEALQVEQAKKDDASIYINADNKTDAIVAAVKSKKYRRLYLAPEQLVAHDNRQLCKDPVWSKDVIAYIIDEAHVVLQSGGSFRPVCQTLSDLRHIGVGKIPIMPVTATRFLQMYDELVEILELKDPAAINMGCQRPNIHLRIQPFRHPLESFADVMSFLVQLETLDIGASPEHLVRTILYIDHKHEEKLLCTELKR